MTEYFIYLLRAGAPPIKTRENQTGPFHDRELAERACVAAISRPDIRAIQIEEHIIKEEDA